VRNCQDTLGKVIESIMAQDYHHELMEVIFVDDGSEDGTLSVIERYVTKMDIHVKIFRHKWKGLGYSRNVVVNNAKGDYIIWVDGDLVITNNYVSTMLEFMEKNPKVAIAGGSYGMLDQGSLVAFLDNVEYVAYRYKSGTNLPGTGGAIYRVKAIKEVGGFDEKIKGSCEDIDVAYRVISAGWSVVRDRALFFAVSKKTWKECWNHSVWHGYGAHYIKHKHNQILLLSRFSPLAALIGGVVYAVTAYRLIRRKLVFLLPLYTLFKNLAWWLGFFKGHIKGYGHGRIKGVVKES